MKRIFVQDAKSLEKIGLDVVLLGWVRSKRNHGNVVFLELCDSTGSIQVVVTKDKGAEFEVARRVVVESAVEMRGTIARSHRDHLSLEIQMNAIKVIGPVTKQFSPSPRSSFDIFDPKLANHLLANRHMYLRNPKVMAILRFRDIMMHVVREWFYQNRYIEIDAPILTPVPLYEDGSALSIDVKGEKVFLTQCVGYYLEAAVHAFERVYNMGPSFRGEESRSKRHLMEYWHIKAEVAFGDREDIIQIVETLISHITERCQAESGEILETLGTTLCLDGLKVPFARIGYGEAIAYLQKHDFDISFGDGLGSEEEAFLSRIFDRPFWVVGIPKKIEPFPYCIDPSDDRITLVADLIASNDYGELLGVAEKISDLAMLEERMRDKGKFDDPRYEWVREVHQVGCVPHIAFGMGVERMIRWLLNIEHVRDAIPFPRIFRRKVYP